MALFSSRPNRPKECAQRHALESQTRNPREEVMQNTYPFGQTNETSGSTSKKEEHGYL